MLMCHWIDESGRWRQAQSPYLDLSGPGHYAFRHLGLAKVAGYHPRTLQWDLKSVQPDAMLAARKWLAEQVGMRPVSLVYYFGGWFVEQVNNALEALDRIDRLNAYRDASPPSTTHEVSVDFDTDVLARPIRMVNDLWHRDRGRLADHDAPTMAALAQHVVVYGRGRRDRDYHTIHIGHQSHLARVLTSDQVRTALATRHATEIDGERLSKAGVRTYRQVIARNEPAFHHLCASVRVKNRPRQWLQLERGLFPFQLPEGGTVLVSASAPRRTVDIPFCP